MITLDNIEKAINEFNHRNISLSEIENGTIRIDTPYYNRHNDSLIIYAIKEKNNLIRLTDGGYTLDDLENEGINLNRSQKRKSIVVQRIKALSIDLNDETNELYTETSFDDFAINQNLLLQAMMFVNDMFVLSRNKVSSIFLSEVNGFFEDNNIRTIPNRNVIGNAGMVHNFDFAISGFKTIPERLIKVMNSSNEFYAKATAMDIIQSKEVLPHASFYTFINDENKVDDKVIKLFESEEIKPILFSERNNYIKELAK